jgi:hypothetical protein
MPAVLFYRYFNTLNGLRVDSEFVQRLLPQTHDSSFSDSALTIWFPLNLLAFSRLPDSIEVRSFSHGFPDLDASRAAA